MPVKPALPQARDFLTTKNVARHSRNQKLNHKGHKGHKEVFFVSFVAFVVKKLC